MTALLLCFDWFPTVKFMSIMCYTPGLSRLFGMYTGGGGELSEVNSSFVVSMIKYASCIVLVSSDLFELIYLQFLLLFIFFCCCSSPLIRRLSWNCSKLRCYICIVGNSVVLLRVLNSLLRLMFLRYIKSLLHDNSRSLHALVGH